MSVGCKCGLATRLVGDGCQYCNPQMAIDLLEERVQELRLTAEEREAFQWAIVAAETFHNVPSKQPFGICNSNVDAEQANKYGAALRGLWERLQ